VKYCIEIATTDFITTEAAVKGGADRIELCSAISEGGITPSFGFIKQCREKFSLPIFPIIRPRSGDFLYTDEEFEIITKDVLLCKQLNCDGVVVGFLKKDGAIDRKKIDLIVKLAYPMEVTFHRAFDRCKDPFMALETIIDAGCQRILTSGQQLKAIDGADMIRQLIMAADDRIIIMPGSGINPDNIKLVAEQTGAVEFHGALRNVVKSKMEFIHPSFSDNTNPWIDAEEVKKVKKALNDVKLKEA
jgi:copper homeostasis protein